MDKMKPNDKIAILAGEPLKECTPGEIRCMYNDDPSDATLADVMAEVNMKVGWLGHEVNDLDNEGKVQDKYMAEYDEWWELYVELVTVIVDKVRHMNKTQGTNYITDGIGYHYMIEPFMEQNGYRNGAGWWIKNDE